MGYRYMSTISETELAIHFVDYFRDYEVYKEVPMSGGRCDIVVQAGPLIIAVEVKTSLNTTVIAQAIRHVGTANYIYVAIPKTRNEDALAICKTLGIGVLEYNPEAARHRYGIRFGRYRGEINHEEAPRVYCAVPANYHRRISKPRLHENMKLSIAGAQHNSMSDFRVTCLEVADKLKQAGGLLPIREVFTDDSPYHYGSARSARHCISILAHEGKIPEFRYESGNLILNK